MSNPNEKDTLRSVSETDYAMLVCAVLRDEAPDDLDEILLCFGKGAGEFAIDLADIRRSNQRLQFISDTRKIRFAMERIATALERMAPPLPPPPPDSPGA